MEKCNFININFNHLQKDPLFSVHKRQVIICVLWISTNTNYFCYYSSIRPAVDSIIEISFILVHWKALILISDKSIIIGEMLITDYRGF